MTDKIPSEAYIIAGLKEMLKAQDITNNRLLDIEREVSATHKLQEKSDVHLTYKINLSKVHTDFEIADFDKVGIGIDSINILPVPFAVSFKLRGITDSSISLEAGDNYILSGHLITRILVTNSTGSGIAVVHVYGRYKEVSLL